MHVQPVPQDEPLSFEALRDVNVRRCVNGFGHTLESWSVAEWMCATAGELGEAANIAKKMLRHRDNVAGNKDEDRDLAALRAKLARELADTVIYLDLCAASQGIDLGVTVRETFNRKSEELGANERL
jgi:NTP pyrophosphatase (non-canonical NTP hydrolase)